LVSPVSESFHSLLLWRQAFLAHFFILFSPPLGSERRLPAVNTRRSSTPLRIDPAVLAPDFQLLEVWRESLAVEVVAQFLLDLTGVIGRGEGEGSRLVLLEENSLNAN